MPGSRARSAKRRGDLSGTTRLALRHAERLAADRLLIVGPPDAAAVAALTAAWPQVGGHVFTRDWAIKRARPEVDCAAWLDPQEPGPDGILVFLPKGRPLWEQTCRMLAEATPRPVPLWIVGTRREGFHSRLRALVREGQVVARVDAAHHAILARLELAPCSEVRRGLDGALSSWELPASVPGAAPMDLEMISAPGVFGHGRLDDGTRLLLQALPARMTGRLLDLGCGCGVLGAALAARAPEAEVWLADRDALAVACARRTLAANGLDSARAVGSDGLSDLAGRFDHVVTNPPFHEGVATDYGFVERLSRELGARLSPRGHLWLVANRHLRYRPLLESAFGEVREVVADRTFRVYHAHRPRSTSAP
jgi:16S rRNA (guanine1207-N2)-methyltransferase